MELVIPNWEPSQTMLIKYGSVIFCILIAMLSIIANIIIKKKRGRVVDLDEIIQTSIVFAGLVFALIFIASNIYEDVFYVFDYKKDDKIQVEEIIVDVDYSRRYCKIWTEQGNYYSIGNYKYELVDYEQAYEFIQEELIGYKCNIEYFRLSKYFVGIKVIE